MNSRPTMKDVARAAGVSFKTVSRVVNAEAGVSTEVAGRVNVAITELGYEPDARASGLRRRAVDLTAATIGVIHADLANPFFAAVHSGLEEIASEKDVLILTGSSHENRARQNALATAFTRRRVAGLVVVPAADDSSCDRDSTSLLQAEINRGTPLVLVDREIDSHDSSLAADIVMSDHRGGAALAAQHLIDRGHRRIAFLGDDQRLSSATERRQGFIEAMREAGLMPAATTSDVLDQAGAERLTRDWMALPIPERPTALFTAQNVLTCGAVKALHSLGLQREVALVGFDDIEMGDVIEPGITVVAQDARDLGRRAGRLLFERIEGDRSSPKRSIVPLSLVERGSGEITTDREGLS